VTYDSIANRGDYLSPHYLAEVLPKTLREKGGLRARWAERDKVGQPTPAKGMRELRRGYFDARLTLSDPDNDEDLRKKTIIERNGSLLLAHGHATTRE
jgi:hypothetical protein